MITITQYWFKKQRKKPSYLVKYAHSNKNMNSWWCQPSKHLAPKTERRTKIQLTNSALKHLPNLSKCNLIIYRPRHFTICYTEVFVEGYMLCFVVAQQLTSIENLSCTGASINSITHILWSSKGTIQHEYSHSSVIFSAIFTVQTWQRYALYWVHSSRKELWLSILNTGRIHTEWNWHNIEQDTTIRSH